MTHTYTIHSYPMQLGKKNAARISREQNVFALLLVGSRKSDKQSMMKGTTFDEQAKYAFGPSISPESRGPD